jgi:hypothetical protein
MAQSKALEAYDAALRSALDAYEADRDEAAYDAALKVARETYILARIADGEAA